MLYLLCYLFCLVPFCFSVPARHEEHVFPTDDVIELPVGRFPDPECEYVVRNGGPKGSRVSGLVRVGDELFHEWSCNYGNHDASMYCMMVTNCTVRAESTQQKVPILDEFGCSLFPTIVPHVEYSDDLVAGLYAHAFALDVDKAAVLFECSVKMLLKLNGVCRRPSCPSLQSLQQGNKSSSRKQH